MTMRSLIIICCAIAVASCSKAPLFGCPSGTHISSHIIDTYDASPLGSVPGGASQRDIGKVISPGNPPCWPDDKPGG